MATWANERAHFLHKRPFARSLSVFMSLSVAVKARVIRLLM